MKQPIIYLQTVFILLLLGIPSLAQQVGKPNIIVYLSDDLGYLDTSPYGAKVVSTPVLQQLSEEGITFENAFIASPSCAPSRAAFLTGLMPARNGAEANHSFPDEGVSYLIKNFKDNGYRVYAFGKVAHYGGNEKCGFDYHNDQQVNLEKNIRDFFDSVGVKEPVCLFIGDRRPHVAWSKQMDYDPAEVDLPEYFIDTKSTREYRSRYYTDITGLDSEMGRILDYLGPRFGTNTLTLFTSDHGAQWPFAKWNLYDAGIRTPLIVKWPGVIQPGSTTEAMVSWVDLLPTLLDISGAEVPGNLDGKSFKKVLHGKTNQFRQAIYTTHTGDGKFNVYPIRSIRTARYKLIMNLAPNAYHTNHSDILRKDGSAGYWDSWDEKAARDSKAAAIIHKYYQRPAWEFYDLQSDPGEQDNLIDDPAARREINDLKKKLNKWLASQHDQMKPHREPYPLNEAKPNKQFIEKTEAFSSHNKAIYIKKGWIRDPFIYLDEDGYYYLTGTTPVPNDSREKDEPYNTGLDKSNQEIFGTPSIVGPMIRVWRSKDLLDWEYLGEPFSLEKGYWAKKFPDAFEESSPEEWRIWAPEIYHVNGKWIYVHTTPGPVKGGANLAITAGSEMDGPFSFPMGDDMQFKHDPSLFKDDDSTWYLLWGNTEIAPIKPDFQGLAAEPVKIDPANRVIGHEGATIRKIGDKYVHFGTAWSTDQMRKGSYNLYYCTADKVTGPYGPRKFVGRFLGHGTPFQDKQGRWWCTAFYNGNVPPLSRKGIQDRNLNETAQTINRQGTTIVPLEVKIQADGEIYIRAKDPDYANPGPDESQQFD